MSDQIKIQAPIELEMKISITDGEGTEGIATIGLGKGIYFSEERMREALMDFEANKLPDGFRLMTKREWFDTVCPPLQAENELGEMESVGFAIPGGEEWDE